MCATQTQGHKMQGCLSRLQAPSWLEHSWTHSQAARAALVIADPPLLSESSCLR